MLRENSVNILNKSTLIEFNNSTVQRVYYSHQLGTDALYLDSTRLKETCQIPPGLGLIKEVRR
jgi:hypothetical protein